MLDESCDLAVNMDLRDPTTETSSAMDVDEDKLNEFEKKHNKEFWSSPKADEAA